MIIIVQNKFGKIQTVNIEIDLRKDKKLQADEFCKLKGYLLLDIRDNEVIL